MSEDGKYLLGSNKIELNTVMPDNISEYFANKDKNQEVSIPKELFDATKLNIDLKTDLNFKEIKVINKALYIDEYLIKAGLKPIYFFYVEKWLRLKVSFERNSRKEYVSINNRLSDLSGNVLDTMSKVSNITGGNIRK